MPRRKGQPARAPGAPGDGGGDSGTSHAGAGGATSSGEGAALPGRAAAVMTGRRPGAGFHIRIDERLRTALSAVREVSPGNIVGALADVRSLASMWPDGYEGRVEDQDLREYMRLLAALSGSSSELQRLWGLVSDVARHSSSTVMMSTVENARSVLGRLTGASQVAEEIRAAGAGRKALAPALSELHRELEGSSAQVTERVIGSKMEHIQALVEAWPEVIAALEKLDREAVRQGAPKANDSSGSPLLRPLPPGPRLRHAPLLGGPCNRVLASPQQYNRHKLTFASHPHQPTAAARRPPVGQERRDQPRNRPRSSCRSFARPSCRHPSRRSRRHRTSRRTPGCSSRRLSHPALARILYRPTLPTSEVCTGPRRHSRLWPACLTPHSP